MKSTGHELKMLRESAGLTQAKLGIAASIPRWKIAHAECEIITLSRRELDAAIREIRRAADRNTKRIEAVLRRCEFACEERRQEEGDVVSCEICGRPASKTIGSPLTDAAGLDSAWFCERHSDRDLGGAEQTLTRRNVRLRECLELCRSALEPIATQPDAPFIVVSAYENACKVLGVPTSGTKSPEVAPET